MDYLKEPLDRIGEDTPVEQHNNMPNAQSLEAVINEGLRAALLEDTPDQSLQVLLEYLGKSVKRG